MSTPPLEQDTISDTQIIFTRIKDELSNAQHEILVAMAWFTDDELFNVLVEKLSEGVDVFIIISDQPDNEKLDFEIINRLGGEMIKIKNVGYGMMHQKFCVIDRKVSISGSYNWSINAKNNNHENVLVTNDRKTVLNYVQIFFDLRYRSIKQKEGMDTEELKIIDPNTIRVPAMQFGRTPFKNEPAYGKTSDKHKEISFQEQSLNEFKSVLDNIIATEVGSFDKNLLKDDGYNRAAENNGDHQVIPQAMDSLFSNFINEIEVIEEKKIRLKCKIEEQQKISVANVDLKTQNEINTCTENLVFEKINAEERVHGLGRDIESKILTTTSNNKTRIPFIHEQISRIEKKIFELKVDFVKPPFNRPLMICLSLMGLLLVAYIFVFYSSVAYIFIFLKEDTKKALVDGVQYEAVEVFNPHAITEIFSKGTGGIMFMFLFVSIPVALGMYKLFTAPLDLEGIRKERENQKDRSWWKPFFNKHGSLALILLVDTLIAFKVAKNINDIAYLTNQTDTRIGFADIFISNEFWMVFILGSLGVYLFSVVFNKFMHAMNLRNTTFQQERSKFEVGEYERGIEQLKGEINDITLENDKLQNEVAVLEREKEDAEQNLQMLPIRHNEKIKDLNQVLVSYKEQIGNIANVYKSQIDNDKLPISKTEMENRMNIFMEGWSKYLYETYSVSKAEAKTGDAINETEVWLKEISVRSLKTPELSRSILSN